MTLRSPRALGFTFAFPLVLVTLFSAINGDVTSRWHGVDIPFSQYYTPAIGVFGLTMACYTTLLNGLANAREAGLLKRVRGTPLPMPVYLGSWVAGAVLTGLASVRAAVRGRGARVRRRRLPRIAARRAADRGRWAARRWPPSRSRLGSLVRTAEQAQPLSQLTFLPISFISGIWFPLDDAPQWVKTAADIFPLSHIVDAFSALLRSRARPRSTGATSWSSPLWGAGGMVVATPAATARGRGRVGRARPAAVRWTVRPSPRSTQPRSISAAASAPPSAPARCGACSVASRHSNA